MIIPHLRTTSYGSSLGFIPPIKSGLLTQIDVATNGSNWADTGRTVLAVTSGSTVQGVKDFSGNGNHWYQSNASISPQLVPSPANGKWILRFPNTGYYTMDFTNNLTTIRTVYWAINQSPLASPPIWSCCFLGHSVNYNFHAGQSGCFSGTNSYSSVNLLRIDKTSVALETARPTTLKVVTAQTSTNSSANRFSYDRTETARSWQGDLALLLIYSDLHDTTQMSTTEDAIKTYLSI